MEHPKESYINYGKEKIFFSLPKKWNLISDQDRSYVKVDVVDICVANFLCPGSGIEQE